MVKLGQSLLDFINFFPIQAALRSPISNREAQSLFSIWSSKRNEKGDILIPETVDSLLVASLKTKGLIRSKYGMVSLLGRQSENVVEITKKGKEIIRNIILYTEKNAFEKKSEKEIDYESIYIAMTEKPVVTADKELPKLASRWLYEYEGQ